MPDTDIFEIGIYEQRHLYFLQYYRRVIYTNLLTNGNINKIPFQYKCVYNNT